MTSRLWPWLLLCALWMVGVAVTASNTWPTVPLDIPARDPDVQAALARAIRTHVLEYGTLGLAPAALTCAILWWRRR